MVAISGCVVQDRLARLSVCDCFGVDTILVGFSDSPRLLCCLCFRTQSAAEAAVVVLLMLQTLHYLEDPKLWELWYTPYLGKCRIYHQP